MGILGLACPAPPPWLHKLTHGSPWTWVLQRGHVRHRRALLLAQHPAASRQRDPRQASLGAMLAPTEMQGYPNPWRSDGPTERTEGGPVDDPEAQTYPQVHRSRPGAHRNSRAKDDSWNHRGEPTQSGTQTQMALSPGCLPRQ
ncbi:hypothetical protein H8959_003180 [Pygathrix nigripes]